MQVKEVEIIYPEWKAGASSEYVLTELSEDNNKLYALLDLEKYSKKQKIGNTDTLIQMLANTAF